MIRLFMTLSLIIAISCSPLSVFANSTATATAPTTPAADTKRLTIHTFLHNKWQKTDIVPHIRAGVALVPLRLLTSQAGAKVRFFERTQRVVVQTNIHTIDMVLNKPALIFNGAEEELEVAPQLVQGVTMVPIRKIAEKLDFQVMWDDISQSIYLVKRANLLSNITKSRFDRLTRGYGVIETIAANQESLIVTASKSIRPSMFTLAAPKRVVIDLQNTMLHPTNPLRALNQHPSISNIRFALSSSKPPIARIVIDLKHDVPSSLLFKPQTNGFIVRLAANPAESKSDQKKPEPPKPEPPKKEPPKLEPPKQEPPKQEATKNDRVKVTAVRTSGNNVVIQLNRPVTNWRTSLAHLPSRVVLDLPDTFVDEKLPFRNTTSIEGITQIRAAQNSHKPPLVKIVFDLNQKLNHRVTQADGNKQIVFLFTKPAPPPLDPKTDDKSGSKSDPKNDSKNDDNQNANKPDDAGETKPNPPTPIADRVNVPNPLEDGKLIVVIDAGHGGLDSGAVSPFRPQNREKDFNLSIALKVQQLMAREKQYELLLTRSTDVFWTLNERVDFANQTKADAFISIHANSFRPAPNVRGVETFYSRPESIPLAEVLHRHLLEATGFPNRNVKQADFRVIKSTVMPAVLLEAGFLTNLTDESMLFDEAFQLRVAQSIVDTIKEYFAKTTAPRA